VGIGQAMNDVQAFVLYRTRLRSSHNASPPIDTPCAQKDTLVPMFAASPFALSPPQRDPICYA